MSYDPVTGKIAPQPSDPQEYREHHGLIAWLYNPYTGTKRDPRDIANDIEGILIVPEGGKS